MFSPNSESVWPVIYKYRLNAAIGSAIGFALGFGAKYVAAAFLILWLMTGGQ